jgi:hypothetical protein
MATKRKGVFPERLYKRGWTGGSPDEGRRLKRLTEAIPTRRFEDAEFIPNLPNIVVSELIWPKICKPNEEDPKGHFRQALKMRSVSKFWLAFVDQTDAVLNLHCLFILKKTIAKRAAAPGRFRH